MNRCVSIICMYVPNFKAIGPKTQPWQPGEIFFSGPRLVYAGGEKFSPPAYTSHGPEKKFSPGCHGCVFGPIALKFGTYMYMIKTHDSCEQKSATRWRHDVMTSSSKIFSGLARLCFWSDCFEIWYIHAYDKDTSIHVKKIRDAMTSLRYDVINVRAVFRPLWA